MNDLILLICAVENLEIDDSSMSLNFKGFNLRNHNSAKMFVGGELILYYGLEVFNKLNTSPIFFSLINDNEFSKETDSVKLHALTETGINLLQAYIHCLWFIKDCCVRVDTIYLEYKLKNKVLSRTKCDLISNSKGKFDKIKFLKAELDIALSYLHKLNDIINFKINLSEEESKEKWERTEITPGDFNYIDYKATNRIHRAFNFLTLARINSFLPQKIMFYISCCESLFSTDPNEITHKVSERIACYIGNDFKDKIEIFDLVKKCYSTRSKYIHGQKLDSKDLSETSFKIDSEIRKLFIKIIYDKDYLDNQNKNPDDFEKWLKNLIFIS